MSKIKIAVAGCLGRMGQEIVKQVIKNKKLIFIGGFEHKSHPKKNKSLKEVTSINSNIIVADNPIQSIKEADVLIDFTTPTSTLLNAKIAASHKTAIVIGTTGISEAQKNKIKNYSKKIPILMSSNMSLTVNLIFNLVNQTASILNDEEYDIEISETHHKHKKDAPSGTALTLGEVAALGRKTTLKKKMVLDRTNKKVARKKGDIGFSVTRGGEIAGEHTVSFIGEHDRIDLVHKANNRSIFVSGAVKAAVFLAKKSKGLYDMNKIIHK